MVILFLGCSIFENEQSIPNSLIGEWEWTLTSGGWGTHIVADSVDYSMSLFVYSQNEAEWYRNDSLEKTYLIKDGKEDWKEGAFLMRLTPETPCRTFRAEVISDEHELVLYTVGCTDLPNHYFRRAKS